MADVPIRQFLKHVTYGEIWAVEWASDKRELPIGCHRCSRPEEQTNGALPVLFLEQHGEGLQWIEDNRPDLEPWEPPRVPVELLEKIAAAGRITDDAERDWKTKDAAAKASKKEWERSAQALSKLVREACDFVPLPLLDSL